MLLSSAFVGYRKLKFWINEENQKKYEARKRLSQTIDELRRSIQNLNYQQQNLEQKVKLLEKQISSDSSRNTFLLSEFQERQQHLDKDKIQYSSSSDYVEPTPIQPSDPYQEAITAFNIQDRAFFQQNTYTYYLALDESTIDGETSAGAKRIVRFVDVDSARDALCLAIMVNSEYLIFPNFFSPYYDNLDQWLSDNQDIFQCHGQGIKVQLCQPGKVQYSQTQTWDLTESIILNLE
ncbi:hypothetical protein NIES970_27720 (plasmid) [[Synechococcus] sp. NIES-970]|nr:hypothetical protein NIES970_27720 [[Synechococcus] sp. NIES-970]